jgi:hypothetical protein
MTPMMRMRCRICIGRRAPAGAAAAAAAGARQAAVAAWAVVVVVVVLEQIRQLLGETPLRRLR